MDGDIPFIPKNKIFCADIINFLFPYHARGPPFIFNFIDFKIKNKGELKMFKHNEGIEESDILQNQFTACILIIIRRIKTKYMRIKKQVQLYEQSLEILENDEDLLMNPDMLLGLPIMEQIENEKLHTALTQAKAKERYILFAKAVDNRSFVDIAAELGIKPNTAAIIYYRLIKNLKHELGD